MSQTLILSEHEDEVQNRYKEKHTSQTLKGALIFDDDLPLKAALNDRTRLPFLFRKSVYHIKHHLKMINTKGKHINPLTLLGWGPPAEQ